MPSSSALVDWNLPYLAIALAAGLLGVVVGALALRAWKRSRPEPPQRFESVKIDASQIDDFSRCWLEALERASLEETPRSNLIRSRFIRRSFLRSSARVNNSAR